MGHHLTEPPHRCHGSREPTRLGIRRQGGPHTNAEKVDPADSGVSRSNSRVRINLFCRRPPEPLETNPARKPTPRGCGRFRLHLPGPAPWAPGATPEGDHLFFVKRISQRLEGRLPFRRHEPETKRNFGPRRKPDESVLAPISALPDGEAILAWLESLDHEGSPSFPPSVQQNHSLVRR